MNFVQWYYSVFLVLAVCIELWQHDEPRQGRHDFRVFFVASIFSLPITGRIFGWW